MAFHGVYSANMKPGKPPDERAIRALLDKYACPVPYHEVRARFLGNIATPALSVSPLQIVKGLWGGELPPFESLDGVNELIGALVNGLWNDLTRHQKRTQPFRLTRLETEPTAANLDRYSRVRLQELEGFIKGLFNGEKVIELPERAHRAIEELSELRGMLAGICDLVARGLSADDHTQIMATFNHLRAMNRIMEDEINEIVLSCTRARRQMLAGIATERPTLH